MKRIFTLAASLASLAVLAMPEVQNLSVSQNNNRMVAISFTLSEKAIVTMDITTNGVSIGADNYQMVRDALANDNVFPANKIVAAGQHLWTWRPTREWPGFHFGNNEFAVKVQAWLEVPQFFLCEVQKQMQVSLAFSPRECWAGL